MDEDVAIMGRMLDRRVCDWVWGNLGKLGPERLFKLLQALSKTLSHKFCRVSSLSTKWRHLSFWILGFVTSFGAKPQDLSRSASLHPLPRAPLSRGPAVFQDAFDFVLVSPPPGGGGPGGGPDCHFP